MLKKKRGINMKQPKRLKVGDYVELIGLGNAGIDTGEVGIVISDYDQQLLELLFPASTSSIWNIERQCGWIVKRNELKLLQRYK